MFANQRTALVFSSENAVAFSHPTLRFGRQRVPPFCEKRTAFVSAARGLDECEAFVFPSDPTSAAALDQLFGQGFVFRFLVCPRLFFNKIDRLL